MPSATLTPAATETPQPALSVEEARKRAEELLLSNADCELPCWWGIVPGLTSWSAAEAFLYQFYPDVYTRAATRHEPFVLDIPIPVREEISPIGQLVHYYSVDAGTVQLLEVRDGTLPTYNLSYILTTYGMPDEIWVMTTPDPPSGVVDFEVVVFYLKWGIIAIYNQVARQSEPTISVCLSPLSVNTLILWAISEQDDAQSVINRTSYKDGNYYGLQEATQVSVIEFVEQLAHPNSELCLATPISIWH